MGIRRKLGIQLDGSRVGRVECAACIVFMDIFPLIHTCSGLIPKCLVLIGLDVSNVLGLGCEFGMRIALWLQFFMELYSSIASTTLVKATRKKKDGETNLIDGQFLRKLCFVEEQISSRQS